MVVKEFTVNKNKLVSILHMGNAITITLGFIIQSLPAETEGQNITVTVEQISEATGLSVASVYKSIKKLMNEGILHKYQNGVYKISQSFINDIVRQ